jgi:hypothetical protein
MDFIWLGRGAAIDSGEHSFSQHANCMLPQLETSVALHTLEWSPPHIHLYPSSGLATAGYRSEEWQPGGMAARRNGTSSISLPFTRWLQTETTQRGFAMSPKHWIRRPRPGLCTPKLRGRGTWERDCSISTSGIGAAAAHREAGGRDRPPPGTEEEAVEGAGRH